ncbi:hypothetical protein EN781_09740 [Mesorhizobium sp. M4A.F.Ca.ET.090.04.2.1]|uniref:DUF6074 family protein n=1 Tax=Mesorhizobium sp. M4A.F.Ca.ET.090.04.2.1 TaxID=2496663 RepID=UPI000FCB2103|nr:DUF6074 family protein [Mesorhizobium sp. M4A.F.Ca.ET.090.04.2.1]RVC45468.1 hypothetical protein EN781_09740 [Mesorhizobium sp. M4A.F.Ca.ET.090.04.2.1]
MTGNHHVHGGRTTIEIKGAPIVAVFPLAFRRSEVRAAAAELLQRNRYLGRQWWAAHVKAHRRGLRELGLAPDEIDREIKRYASAVSQAIHLPTQYRSTPEDAA